MLKATIYFTLFTATLLLIGCDPPDKKSNKQAKASQGETSKQVEQEQKSSTPSIEASDVETEVDIVELAQASATVAEGSVSLGETMKTTADMLAASEKMLQAFSGAHKKLFEVPEEAEPE